MLTLKYLYYIVLFLGGIKSYKLSLYMIWISLLFFPTLINSTFRVHDLGIAVTVLCCFIHKEHWDCFVCFTKQHMKFFIIFLLLLSSIMAFSQTVPFSFQWDSFSTEIMSLALIFETFLLANNDYHFSRNIMKIICICIIFHLAFCLIFEVVQRFNPAGMSLYIAMGHGEDVFLTDMSDYERGIFDYRVQSVFGHPLSLGQYMIIIYPVLFLIKRKYIRLFLQICVWIIVLLTGTRGAYIPLFLITLFMLIRNVHNLQKTVVWGVTILSFVVVFSLLGNGRGEQQVEKISKYFIFWDDRAQENANFRGSSMQMRKEQFNAAFDEISENPLFGRGLKYREYFQTKYGAVHPKLYGFESAFFLYLVERGWIGFFLFIATLLFMLEQYKKVSANTFLIYLIFLSYLLSIFMSGVRQYSFIIVGLACAILCGMGNKKERLGMCKFV